MSIRWFRSLRTEGTALLVCFVLAVELAYAYAALSALHETSARVAAERLEDARSLAQRFDGLLSLARERLSAVAEQPGLALWLAANAADSLPRNAAIPQRETLHYLFFRSEIFSGPVAVVDRNGALLFTEPYDAERVDARLYVNYAPLRQAMAQRKGQVSRVPLPWRPGPSAVLVEPIVDLSGQPVGAIIGEIALGTSKLAGFLGEPRYGAQTLAALLDEDGSPLLESPRAELLRRPSVKAELPSAGATSIVSAGSELAGGLRFLAARAQLHEAPWSVVVAQDDQEAFASIGALQRRLILTGLLLGVAAVAFSLLILGRVVRPLEVLTEAAQGVPAGEFDRPLPERAPGELGELARTFEVMRRELQATLRGLRDSEERYRRSIDSANDAIFAVDPVALHVLSANKKACELLGAPEAQLLQRGFVEVNPPDHQVRARDFLAHVAAAGEGTLPDLDLSCANGARVPVSVSASLIVHGSGRFLQLICRDLSERKKMERELVQAEKLSTVGVLAAGILHELNTPLAYIQANLEEASIEVARLPEGKEARALKAEVADALEGSLRAATIVRDLRIFARDQQGGSGVFDLNDAVRMAMRMAMHELKYRATLTAQLGELPVVAGQATELSQVFLNLLVNAAHAIEPGQVTKNHVRVVTEVAAGKAVARISDTGSGIAPDVLARIFDPFFTTKPEGVGTGLGLAISRDIVLRVGGAIRVESTLGQGTTFTVELPLAR